MICEECGNRGFAPVDSGAPRVFECELCGHLQGDDDAVLKELRRREASELGWQTELLELSRAIEKVPGLKLERVQPGDAERGVMPTLFFALKKGPASRGIQNLVVSLTIAMTRTHHRWLLELTYQHHLLLVLRPRLFHPLDVISAEEVERALEDVKALNDALRRDMELAWWNHP